MRWRQLILSALVLALAGGTANAAQKLTMNYTTGESATAFIAKDEGFFAKHGLDVDLVAVTQNHLPGKPQPAKSSLISGPSLVCAELGRSFKAALQSASVACSAIL